MTKKTYSQKLLDPRWQKKRLQILERDKWSCQHCSDKENTLHVHHKYYDDLEPWQYPDKAYITLCKECHRIETEELKFQSSRLIEAFKKFGFDADNLSSIAWVLENTELEEEPFFATEAICEVIVNKNLMAQIIRECENEFHKPSLQSKTEGTFEPKLR